MDAIPSASNADEILLTASPKIGPAAPTLVVDWFKDEDQKNILVEFILSSITYALLLPTSS